MKNKVTQIAFWPHGIIAAILPLVLLTLSCGGQKQLSESNSRQTDSLVIRERSQITQVTVPRTQAALRLELKDVANLTPGAVFTKSEGQATVAVERRDSIIYITATCDSLQMLVETQSREIYHLRSELEQQRTQIEKPPGWWATFKNNAFYILVGMGLMLILILIKKIWERIKQPVNLLR